MVESFQKWKKKIIFGRQEPIKKPIKKIKKN